MLVTELPYKRNGSTVKFFDDHLEYGKKSVRYDDIVGFYSMPVQYTRHMLNGIIPTGRSFNGAFRMKLADGKSCTIALIAFSMFGIPMVGSVNKFAEMYPPLFEAFYGTVARKIAQRHLDIIRAGATVELAGLKISSTSATYTTRFSKKTTLIDRYNYGHCLVTAKSVSMLDNQDKPLWDSLPSNADNSLLIPYIFDGLFGSTE